MSQNYSQAQTPPYCKNSKTDTDNLTKPTAIARIDDVSNLASHELMFH